MRFDQLGRLAVATAAVALVLSAGSGEAPGAPGQTGLSFAFGLIGDQRYTADQRSQFPNLIKDMNAAKLAFVVHDGNIGAAPADCADDYYLETRNLFDQFAAPLIYTPGDNEWLDCNSRGYDPLERLRSLRRLFFATDQSDGKRTLDLTRQRPHHPENARWTYGSVTFATLHVVGNNDGFDGEKFAARRAANLTWLDETFDLADRNDSGGIVLIWHADPFFGDDAPAYNDIRGALRARTIAFDRPVVLVHGHSHSFRIDKPMVDDRGQRVDNFTRVETFGPADVHWVSVTVDPADPGLFTFRARIVAANGVARESPNAP